MKKLIGIGIVLLLGAAVGFSQLALKTQVTTNDPGAATIGDVLTATAGGHLAWAPMTGGGGGAATNAISIVRSNGTTLTTGATEIRFFNFSKLTNAAGVISLEQDVSTAYVVGQSNNLFFEITNRMTITSNGLVLYIVGQSNALSARLLGTNTALLSTIAAYGLQATQYTDSQVLGKMNATNGVALGMTNFGNYQGYGNVTASNLIASNSITAAGDISGLNLVATSATASRAAYFDSLKRLVSSATTDVQLGYLSDTTGPVQANFVAGTNNVAGLRAAFVLTSNDVQNLIALLKTWTPGVGLSTTTNNGTNVTADLAIDAGSNVTLSTNTVAGVKRLTIAASGGGGGGTGINTNSGSGTNNSFVGMLSSNSTFAGSYLYTNVTATANIDWAFLSQALSLNSNTTFTCSNTNLSSEVQVQVANTASSNITITLPSNVILTALQSNAPIVLSANTTNFLYFMRDANNKLWLTVNGPSSATTGGGGAGLTFDNIRSGNFIIFDDFQESAGSGSATWGPFHFIRNNGGTGAIVDQGGTTNAPGILRMKTGTTAGSWVAFYNYSSAGTAPYLIRGTWTNEIRFRLNALQNPGTATYRFACGFGNSTSSAESTEAMQLRYDTNDTHLVYISASGGGTLKTTNATSLTPVAATWYKFREVVNVTASLTNVTFTIEDANSVTYAASNSIPSGAVVGLHHQLFSLSGTTDLSVDVDYVALAPFLPVSR
jgi:hypothetical protein